MSYIIVQTTTNDVKVANLITKILLTKRLCACIQQIDVLSSYIWNDEIIKSNEIQLSIKTKRSLYTKIEKVIKENSSYEVPQIIVIDITDGSKEYLDWMGSELRG
ncbi:MAG: Divalent-cation tolerance protein CutA [uncultured Campylobacterales bacterium]|uniref:Divalent-cation tolerance protein CutA n=1 Tax=uncultured Campylobacterales bacterium TaxID=352960 RepID=A0A6S6SQD4_9BACT|nr:MAG: Divalent-cation tolerance protein CutA [uncultured Campylobacterales bacterium]